MARPATTSPRGRRLWLREVAAPGLDGRVPHVSLDQPRCEVCEADLAHVPQPAARPA